MQLASSMSHSWEGTMLNSPWVQDSRDGIMQLPSCIINSAVIGASLSEPHIDETFMRELFIYIYICMYGTTVTRGAAHTRYTVHIPKYSAQYRPHVVMFASSTAQACNIHCHVFKF